MIRGFTKFSFKQMLKVSAFYLQKQKSLIPKKVFLSHCQYQNKKALYTDPIFSEGFGSVFVEIDRRNLKVILLNVTL